MQLWRAVALVFLVVAVAAATLFGRHIWNVNRTPTTLVKETGSSANDVELPPINERPKHYDGPVWFREITDSGIDFHHHSGTSPEKPFPAANGSGIATFDFDLDGLQDIYFLTGTDFPVDLSRSESINRLYRNMGSWRFKQVTAPAGVGYNGYSAGVTVGDYDNDGFSDIYVTCYGTNVLYHNLGDGTFERQEVEAGVADDRWATSAAFFDANRDGLLDLYVCNYGKWSLETNQYCGDRQRGIRFYCSPTSITPESDVFYLNQGDGTFRNATAEVGLDIAPGRGQGIVTADLNDDGWVDIYIGNDLTPNFLFLNNGDGTYRDVSEISSTAYDYLGQRQAGMGVDAADVNGDGRYDLFVTNFENEHNTLYENKTGELFQDATSKYNLLSSSKPWVGWGARFIDFDLDTWEDLIVTNGHVDDNRHLLGQQSSHAQPALLLRSLKGQRFESLELQGGSYFAQRHVGRALTTSDLDNDGDMDVVVGHQDNPPGILDNIVPVTRRGAQLHLIGTTSNRNAIGTQLVAKSGDRVQRTQLKGGMSYLSAIDLRHVFAVPEGVESLELEIRWPSGTVSSLQVASGQQYVVWEPIDDSAPLRTLELLPAAP